VTPSATSPWWATPKFSIDEERPCPRCGKPFVFTASEKRFWRGKFSPMGLDFHTSSILCPRCRSEESAERHAAQELGKAVERVTRQPDDAGALLTLARATAEYALAEGGEGNLDRAIAAARRARRIKPNLHEALYWEAVCHDLAGREQKARVVYQAFVESAHVGRSDPKIQTALHRIAQAKDADADS
jgi:hypothetical protein